MLPRPRPRPDPGAVRDRLRALASGEALLPDEHGAVPGPSRRWPLPLPPVSLRPVLVAVALTAAAAWLVMRTVLGGPATPVELVAGSPVPTGPASAGAAATSSATAPAEVVVHVLGEVRHPGLVRLPQGSRVADAIAASGGLAPGGSTGGLNLARVVSDGEQVVVSADSPAEGTASTGGAPAVVVDLNSATLEQLDSLPGVGPVLAGRILDWRTANGRFTSVDQLREVSGIGARTYERLVPLVRV